MLLAALKQGNSLLIILKNGNTPLLYLTGAMERVCLILKMNMIYFEQVHHLCYFLCTLPSPAEPLWAQYPIFFSQRAG